MSLLQCAQERSGSIESIEREMKVKVREIVRAYRHSWDVYSELLQNSVDAINRRFRIMNDPDYYRYDEYRVRFPQLQPDPSYRGKIAIRISVQDKEIEVRDNGVGIASDNIERFLLPDGSDKRMGQEYGFKGYGLTYVAFISRSFSIVSQPFLPTEADVHEFALTGLFAWLTSDENTSFPDGPVPNTQPTVQSSAQPWNTIVKVSLDDDYVTRFPAISSAQQAIELVGSRDRLSAFEYVLRTRTAIGNTRVLFSKAPVVPIDISLSVHFAEGDEVFDMEIPYRYFHPKEHEEVANNAFEFDEYVGQLTRAGFDRGFSGLYHTVTDVTVGTLKQIKCDYALASISTTRLTNIEDKLGFSEVESGDVDVSYGVYLAIDGMPTGVRIDDWDRRGAYLKRYFVVVDAAMDISNQLDPGRKGISKYYALQMSEKAIELLNTSRIGDSDSFARYAGRYLDYGQSGRQVNLPEGFLERIKVAREKGQQQERTQADTLAKLRKVSSLEYFPSDEQGVVALFHELVARGIIKGYRSVYLAGSSAIYDAALEYSIECIPENTFPLDPVGVGQAFVADLKRQTNSLFYEHKNHYLGFTALPELCVDFKRSIGGLLQEVLMRSGTSSKDPNLLNLIITWDDEIPSSIESTAYTLDTVIDKRRKYHGTTHRLGLTREYSTEIQCIVLKDVLNRLSWL